jgi:hypothetical protein
MNMQELSLESMIEALRSGKKVKFIVDWSGQYVKGSRRYDVTELIIRIDDQEVYHKVLESDRDNVEEREKFDEKLSEVYEYLLEEAKKLIQKLIPPERYVDVVEDDCGNLVVLDDKCEREYTVLICIDNYIKYCGREITTNILQWPTIIHHKK